MVLAAWMGAWFSEGGAALAPGAGLFLAGLLWMAWRMRRSERRTTAGAGWAANFLGGALFCLARWCWPAGSEAGWLVLGLGAASLASVLVGSAFASAAVVAARYKPGRQGWWSGWGAAGLSLILLAPLTVSMGPWGLMAVSRLWLAKANPDAAGQWITDEENNFRFRVPGSPWMQVDPERISAQGNLAFMRVQPNVFVFLIAENVGIDAELDNAQLWEIAKENLELGGAAVRHTRTTQRLRQGLAGIEAETELRMLGQRLVYLHWLCATNGYAYQLIAFGRMAEKEQVFQEADRVFDGFEMMDPTRQALPAGGGSQDFESPRYGYRVRIQDSLWQEWDTLAQDIPEAEFGCLHPRSGAFIVVPISLLDREAPPEHIHAALLALMGIQEADPVLARSKPVTNGVVSGVELDFERTWKEETYKYRVRLMHRNGFAWLASAWIDSNATNAAGLLEETMGRIEFDAGAATAPDLESLSPRERSAHAAFFRSLARRAGQRGDLEAAWTDLDLALRLAPNDETNLADWWIVSRRLSRYREALRTCEWLRGEGASAPRFRAIQAQCEAALEWLPRARETIAAARRESPEDTGLAALEQAVSSRLGGSRPEQTATRLPPVDLPDEPAMPLPPPSAPGATRFSNRSLAIEFRRGQEYRSTERARLTLGNDGRWSQISTLSFRIEPAREEVHIGPVTVLDDRGQPLRVHAETNAWTEPESLEGDRTPLRVWIPIPELEPGRTVEWTVTRRWRRAPAEFPWLEHSLASDLAVDIAWLGLRGNLEAVQHRQSAGIEFKASKESLRWRCIRPPPRVFEPMQPPEAELSPTVWIARSGSWREALEAWRQRDHAEVSLPKELADEARRIAKSETSDPGRVAAMAQWVQRRLAFRPRPWPDSMHRPRADILREGAGDSLDHARLLWALLREAAIPSSVALIRTEGPVQRDLADCAQFDHAVVCAPRGGAERFWDSSEKFADIRAFLAPGLMAREALVLEGAEGRWCDLPAPAIEFFRVQCEREVAMGPDGAPLRMRDVVRIGRYPAAMWDRWESRAEATNRTEWLNQQLAVPGWRIEEADRRRLDGPDSALALRFDWILDRPGAHAADPREWALPAVWERFFLRVAPVADRRTPVHVAGPIDFEGRTRWDMPASWRWLNAAEFEARGTGSPLEWSVRPEKAGGGGGQIVQRARLAAGRHPAAAYDSLYRSVADLIARTETAWIFGRGE